MEPQNDRQADLVNIYIVSDGTYDRIIEATSSTAAAEYYVIDTPRDFDSGVQVICSEVNQDVGPEGFEVVEETVHEVLFDDICEELN